MSELERFFVVKTNSDDGIKPKAIQLSRGLRTFVAALIYHLEFILHS